MITNLSQFLHREDPLPPRLSLRDGKGSAGFHALQKEIPMRHQLSSLSHLSSILLLSVVVFWTPPAWAQAPRLTQVSFEQSNDGVPLGAFHQAKTPLFTCYGNPSPSFPPNLRQIQSKPGLICGSGDQLLLPTKLPVLELARKPNYVIAKAHKEWLTNPPSNVDYQTFNSHDPAKFNRDDKERLDNMLAQLSYSRADYIEVGNHWWESTAMLGLMLSELQNFFAQLPVTQRAWFPSEASLEQLLRRAQFEIIQHRFSNSGTRPKPRLFGSDNLLIAP